MFKILHLDENHPLLINQLEQHGFDNEVDIRSTYQEILTKIGDYQGVVIRSRIPFDKTMIRQARQLKFIARVGAGMENIDVKAAEENDIQLFNAPEGNRNAVGEHAIGLLLSLMNHFPKAMGEVAQGRWLREANRGIELEGKTVGIIGYGNAGKAFARKLKGHDCEVFCHDIKADVSDENAQQISESSLLAIADVISLHVPLTEKTQYLVNDEWIGQVKKPFWLINTARGQCVSTKALVKALKIGKVRGAGLDVLEFEKSSFEDLFADQEELPSDFKYLVDAPNVIITPHIAGWTQESKEKLAQTIVDKIILNFA
jgi:D-3-phosphoglycerate dehydrogenase